MFRTPKLKKRQDAPPKARPPLDADRHGNGGPFAAGFGREAGAGLQGANREAERRRLEGPVQFIAPGRATPWGRSK